MKIPENIINKIKDQAKKEAPLEACGYLAGDADSVKEIFMMTNIDKSPEHFSFDPKEQFRAVKEARKNSLDLIAVYHSHPATQARLSNEDIKLANDPNTVYIIYSIVDDNIKAFKVVGGNIAEEKIEVVA